MDGNVDRALEALEAVSIEILALGLKDIITAGDMNIDLNKTEQPHTRKLKEFYNSNLLEQIIKGNTRTTQHTSTLIDHIAVNRQVMFYQNGILETGISDHDMVYISRKKWKEKQDTTYIRTRSYRKYDHLAYKTDIDNANWDSVLKEEDVNMALTSLYNILLEIIEKHALHKYIKCKDPLPAWFTHELISLIDDRTYRLRKYKKYPTIDNYIKCCEAIRIVNDMKQELQKNHARNTLSACKGNSKATWKELKRL